MRVEVEGREVRLPYLIQRIKQNRSTNPMRTGVDRYFSFDYMGSSEFEFGALSAALRLMRNTPEKLVEEPVSIKVEAGSLLERRECEAWFFGADRDIPVARYVFEDQLQADRKICLKEHSEIAEAYGTVPTRFACNIIGWWALDPITPWVFFKEKKLCEEWIDGFTEPKPEKL